MKFTIIAEHEDFLFNFIKSFNAKNRTDFCVSNCSWDDGVPFVTLETISFGNEEILYFGIDFGKAQIINTLIDEP